MGSNLRSGEAPDRGVTVLNRVLPCAVCETFFNFGRHIGLVCVTVNDHSIGPIRNGAVTGWTHLDGVNRDATHSSSHFIKRKKLQKRVIFFQSGVINDPKKVCISHEGAGGWRISLFQEQ